MTELAGQVAAALEWSVLPTVIARGAAVRVDAVEGGDKAAAVPGITGLTITIPTGQRVRTLPEGDRYLGFIFAEAGTQRDVERALTTARDRLRVVID